MDRNLDVVTVGRCSVDLYGIEVGSALEDVDRFRKSVGGCPANIAVGVARLGLRSSIVTRVGDEQMGKFIREQMGREGVDTSGIVVDPERLTALVLLGVRDRVTFPHIFYRENCADMALSVEDIRADHIASARALVVTGTHFSTPSVSEASWKAIGLARSAGAKVVFDIDFRPVLWGLARHADGEARAGLSNQVTEMLRPVMASSDIVVGTEEEFAAALGACDTANSLAAARRLTRATLVCKKGAAGCEIYPYGVNEVLGHPICGRRFSVQVVNTIGAGDGFMSGFLYGWLNGKDWRETATFANACGAIAVSRLLCSSEYPTEVELAAFIRAQGNGSYAADGRAEVDHLHWATIRRKPRSELFVLAVDHRWQFEDVADKAGRPRNLISDFKEIAVAAALEVSADTPNVGIICDDFYGENALLRAGRAGIWVGRSIEVPKVRPTEFVFGPDVGSAIMTWPADTTLKCLCHYSLRDEPDLRKAQDTALVQVDRASKAIGREFLLEIIAPSGSGDTGEDVARTIAHLARIGIRPDWWKLEPRRLTSEWRAIHDVVLAADPFLRGILILGMESSIEELQQSFLVSAGCPAVRGFAVGRPIVGSAFTEWINERIDDGAAQSLIVDRFRRVIAAWRSSRSAPREYGA